MLWWRLTRCPLRSGRRAFERSETLALCLRLRDCRCRRARVRWCGLRLGIRLRSGIRTRGSRSSLRFWLRYRGGVRFAARDGAFLVLAEARSIGFARRALDLRTASLDHLLSTFQRALLIAEMATAAIEIRHKCVEVIDLIELESVQYRSHCVDPDDLCEAVPQLRIRQRSGRSERSNLLVERQRGSRMGFELGRGRISCRRVIHWGHGNTDGDQATKHKPTLFHQCVHRFQKSHGLAPAVIRRVWGRARNPMIHNAPGLPLSLTPVSRKTPRPLVRSAPLLWFGVGSRAV